MSQSKQYLHVFPHNLLFTLLAGAGLCLAANPVSAIEPGADWVKGRILVQPRAGLDAAEFEKVLKPHGGHALRKIKGVNVQIVELPGNASEKAVLNSLRKHKNIKFAELDYILHAEKTSNDPYTPNEWHLNKMQAGSAWDISLGNGITVAILDTGVDATHPDLAGQLVPGWNMYDNNADTADVYGHGTMVAGVVGAASDNAIGVSSFAWQAKIMPVRISGTDGMASISTIANGLIWAADHGARVANISYAVSGYATVQNAAQYMKNKGGVTVVSAGNSGALDSSLADDTMISVSATDSNDVKTSWSTYGPFVDVSAPGAGIWTTTRGGGYSAVSGTSFSSPATAGTVTLMLAANPQLSPVDVENLLKTTAVDLGTAGWDQNYGYGRVNTFAAVQAAALSVSRDLSAPVVAIGSPGNNATVSGWVSVDASASDNVGVTHVDLLANGVLVASDNASPYAFSWDSTKVSDGEAQLVAYAYDAAGNYSASPVVMVNVKNAVDITPPTVTISSPINGSKIATKVLILAEAKDNVAVANTSLYIDGLLATTVTGGTLSYNWNMRRVSSGTHVISVKAVDTSGNAATSSIQVIK
ncbi:S8 family serine peptidase [Sulfurirhabdus autotrophica]|uniref:Subtilisin family serine protease n=1 Tax=Sulfurirhabdus autotrophica TaxID=1706046 RepID=A0A4R3YB91_9PROT|nr:S8 family serine peptidase [Sulfurirhabdus autotrophica]TCV88991.1 subtilisin family serine protease [Sulfurirhabdus autotrophica]